jgi:hypothetical protein
LWGYISYGMTREGLPEELTLDQKAMRELKGRQAGAPDRRSRQCRALLGF